MARARRARPAPTRTGPRLIWRRGPIRAESCPERAEKSSMIRVTGRSASPESSGRVVLHELQLDGQQEQRAAERAVDDEGDRVGAAELTRAEEVQREHGVGNAPLHDEERGRGECGEDEGSNDHRARPPTGRSLDERVGDAGEEDHGERGAGRVDAALVGGVARFGHVPRRDHEHEDRQRDVDVEDPAATSPPPAGSHRSTARPRTPRHPVQTTRRWPGSGRRAGTRPARWRGCPASAGRRRCPGRRGRR